MANIRKPKRGMHNGDSAEGLNSLFWRGVARLRRRPLGDNEKGGSDSYSSWDNRDAVPRSKRGKAKREPTDAEVRDILVQAMADVGADPALVYAFQKTGVYVCEENEKSLPKETLRAFDSAVDEYIAAITRPPQ